MEGKNAAQLFTLPLGLIKSTHTYAGRDVDESKDVSNFPQRRTATKV